MLHSGFQLSPPLTPPKQFGSDNDDFCAACGGTGELLCCDGCEKSFHLGCIEPPMSKAESKALPEWYCLDCKPTTARGGAVFSDLFESLGRRNVHAFQLPKDVRDHFTGVNTGASGEYVQEKAVNPVRAT